MKVAWHTTGRPYTREGESTITPEMTETQGQKTSGKAWQAALKANRVHMNPLIRAKYRLESNTFRKIEYGWDLQPNYRTHESLKERFAYEGYWGFDPVPYAAWILTQKSYDMGELITQVYAKANEREMDVLTELLEAPDTIKLIADTLAKVRKPILLMKQLAHFLSSNKGLKGTAQYADKASEFWLQYRYGFLPLYLTVQDVIKQFNRDVKVWTRTAKRSSNTEDIELGTFTEYLPDDTGYWLTYNWAPSYRVYFKGETRLQVVLRRCYTLDEIEAKRFGMNPIGTAWELTTLSFVIDWFISVGDFIAAYTPTRASSAKHAESTTRQGLVIWENIPTIYEADDYYEYGKGQVWMKAPNVAVSVHSFHRTVHDGINFRGTLPVGLDLNVNQAVTAFALAWTGLRRGIR